MYKKHRFSQLEKVTVWRACDGLCYWCNEPVALRHVTVDHVFPEKLLDSPNELDAIKTKYCLPADWTVNSYANWVPAHASCNGKKGTMLVRSSPAFLLELEKIQKRANNCEKIQRQWLKKCNADEVVASVMTALENSNLTPDTLRKIADQWPVVKGSSDFTPLLLGDRAGIIEGPASGLLKFVSFETKTLDIASPYIDSTYIAKLRRIASQSIRVRLLTSNVVSNYARVGPCASLTEPAEFFDLRVIKNLHEKMMIVDGATLVLTSANFTVAGMISNFEMTIFTSATDQVTCAADNFELAWAKATPP